MLQPQQNQFNEIATFGLSLLMLGFVTGMVKNMATGAFGSGKSPELLPAVSRTYTAEEIFTRAKKLFGTTVIPDEAGYIFPDGTMLDFSGRHYEPLDPISGPFRERMTDHREIAFAWPEDDSPGGFEAMRQVMNWGAIRLSIYGGTVAINVSRQPTKAQEMAIDRILKYRYPDSEMAVEVDDSDLNQLDYREFIYPFTNWKAFIQDVLLEEKRLETSFTEGTLPATRKPKDRRTAYYVQYWLTRTGHKEDGEPYHWSGPVDQGAFGTLDHALRSASLELESEKPGAYDIDIYSREESWVPDDEYPWHGVWEPVEDTMKIYDLKGAVVWDAKSYLPHSIPVEDLKSIADKYGWWAARLAEAVCPHNDIACVEREASRLVKALMARH